MPEDQPQPEHEDRRVETRRQEDQVEISMWGAMGPHIKASGPMVKQITLLASIVYGLAWGGTKAATELHRLRLDVLETKITIKAMAKQMPPIQQARVAKEVEEQMAFLKLAGLK